MDIKDKCLSGHAYTLKNRKMSLMTGIGGAHMFIDTARKEGLSDEEIGEIILVFIEGMGNVPLNLVNVTDKNGEDVGDIPDNQ